MSPLYCMEDLLQENARFVFFLILYDISKDSRHFLLFFIIHFILCGNFCPISMTAYIFSSYVYSIKFSNILILFQFYRRCSWNRHHNLTVDISKCRSIGSVGAGRHQRYHDRQQKFGCGGHERCKSFFSQYWNPENKNKNKTNFEVKRFFLNSSPGRQGSLVGRRGRSMEPRY